ncbi:WD40 repeat-like protein [Fomitiporia mediterranea MF3/22]|uniref:WD40 repeat-like protein n=1 Tax=Fomitiporia mediterranea (strain MF3/22) TaxID=694068 RepID=UPI0004407678|nr:WD40 repeat-like protein [Fomitiporia mediterranea MF3/22]EJD05585.1 WD40 repeat-like protein [Fomitiporia mediterranea MF3/22]
MKLKEIHRTATFAWSPLPEVPLLVSGTVAGALDESFSNDSQLEIWAPDFMDKEEYDLGGIAQNGPKAFISTTSRFNRLAWGLPNTGRAKGVIAAGMENGELGLWDPEKILGTSDAGESLILRNTTHQGSVRGLDFNPIQTNLLSSGATNGEIYIWDLKDPSKPYSPGTRSSKLDEITSLAWNRQVQYVLASSSSTGYTVVWDLRNKREVVALAYGGATQGLNIMGAAGRKGMSDVAWHPDNATRLVTSSEDDASPVVMVWDLRNARAPEKILTGHERGILSLSWCREDADLLLSCGKDNRALCWNPQTAEVIGELPYADNWAFQVQWCPRNPDLSATAYFDGTIGIHSIQTTNDSADSQAPVPTPKADGSDVFDVPGFSRTTQPTLSLKQPPKWLRRPVSSSFGYGGKLVSVSNLPSAQGKHQSGVVHLRKVVTEPDIIARVKELKGAADGQDLSEFAQKKAADAEARKVHDTASWKALTSLFKTDSREELVTLLGFSKADIAARVAEAVERIKTTATPTQAPTEELDHEHTKPHEPVVSFAEPEPEPEPEQEPEHTPSEQSTSATSDHTDVAGAVDGESTTTAPSLFGDDIGTPQTDAEADFFSTMGTIRSAVPERVQIPHTNYAQDSSVAATVGSRPSSAASETLKNNTFHIYPSEESEIDRLITKSLVMGDFESAVTLCLSAERFADAILLAVKGGPELLQRTQQIYFEKRTINLPYLRLFQSIVTEDLDDIVQNADLQEWREIFVVLCTFAKPDEFANLAEQLGQRLEFHANILKNAGSASADELRKNATLTYLAAGRLEKVVNIWIEEMAEEENYLLAGADERSSSRYSAHAHALQTFMEKVTIFRNATSYSDADLKVVPDPAAAYKLTALYERYYEYADLLATQGLLEEAISFLKLIPSDYQSTSGTGLDFKMARERILAGSEHRKKVAARTQALPSTAAATLPSQPGPYGYQQSSYAAQPVPAISSSTSRGPTYAPYNINGSAVPTQVNNPYAPPAATAPMQTTYQPSVPVQQFQSAYAPSQLSAPSAPVSTAPPPSGPPPPPKKRDNSGWNDAPILDRRTPVSNVPGGKAQAITSPFPNATPPQSVPGSPAMHGPPQGLPPPPRPGSVNRGQSQVMPGPPPPGQRPPGPHGGHIPPPGRTFSPPQQVPSIPGHIPGQQAGPPPPRGPPQFAPPGRVLSPPQAQVQPSHESTQSPYAPPVPRGPSGPPAGPPAVTKPYARDTPPPGWSGPNVPVPQQTGAQQQEQPTGPYAPPPSLARQTLPPGGAAPAPQLSTAPPPQGPPSSSAGPPRTPAAKPGPPQPKYPPGDRSHIPESSRRSYEIFLQALERFKQTSAPPQKRMVDDTERRLNLLFDALNCETLSPPVIERLNVLSETMAAGDRQHSLALHAEMLAQCSRTDDIGLWMSAIKQLIMRV